LAAGKELNLLTQKLANTEDEYEALYDRKRAGMRPHIQSLINGDHRVRRTVHRLLLVLWCAGWQLICKSEEISYVDILHFLFGLGERFKSHLEGLGVHTHGSNIPSTQQRPLFRLIHLFYVPIGDVASETSSAQTNKAVVNLQKKLVLNSKELRKKVVYESLLG